MTKFRGFNNTTISVPKRGLNRRQSKQVQKIILSNKRIKNTYVPITAPFTDVTGATQLANYFQELTLISSSMSAQARSEAQIQLKSYNIKLGLTYYQNDATPTPSNFNIPVTYRVIIVRSKEGPVSDITTLIANASIVNFVQQPDPNKFQIYTDEIFTAGGSSETTLKNNVSLGYLMHFYKSFKNKKVPHMIVGWNEADTPGDAADINPIYMKVIVDPNATVGDSYNFQLQGFCHLKYFDKE